MIVHNGDNREAASQAGRATKAASACASSRRRTCWAWSTARRGVMTAAPYRVLAADHWAFAGTGLGSGDMFGEASLHERIPGGASGHETDKISPSSPPGMEHLAKGLNPDDGGGDIVLLRPRPRRRRVFGRLDLLAQPRAGRRRRIADHGQRAAPVLRNTEARVDIAARICPHSDDCRSGRRARCGAAHPDPLRRARHSCARWRSCCISIGCASARPSCRFSEDLGLTNPDRLCAVGLHGRLWPVRGADRPLGRSLWLARRAGADRGLVVAVHGVDRRGQRAVDAGGRAVFVRRGRGGCLSERGADDRPLVSARSAARRREW